MSVEESFLRCMSCGQDAGHEVVYVGRFVTRIECSHCGAQTSLDISEEYLPDLRDRISTKPRRLASRLRDHPLSAAVSMPGRLVSKPLRMLDELRAVRRSRRSGG